MNNVISEIKHQSNVNTKILNERNNYMSHTMNNTINNNYYNISSNMEPIIDEPSIITPSNARQILEFQTYHTVKKERFHSRLIGASDAINFIRHLHPADVPVDIWGRRLTLSLSPAEELRNHDRLADAVSRIRGKTRKNSLMHMTPTAIQNYFKKVEPHEQDESDHGDRSKELERLQMPKYMLHPHEKIRLRWDFCSIFFIFYNAIVIPFRLAFDDNVGGTAIDFLERIIDLFVFIDIIMNLNTAAEVDGKIVYNRKKIIIQYAKTWLLVDVVAAFPFSDIIYISNGEIQNIVFGHRANQLSKLLKLFRIFRLFRMLRISRILNRLEYALLIRSTISSILKFCLIVMLASHWGSCIFYGIGNSNAKTSRTWVSKLKLNEDSYTTSDRYVAALYWSIMTITTIGYGDISTVTAEERLFGSMFMIVGAVIFAYGITNIIGLVSSLSTEENEFRQKMDEVNEYMASRGLPEKLRGEIREFYLNSRQSLQTKLAMESELLDQVSSMLRSKIALAINDHFLKKMPFFIGSDPEFIMEIALGMRMVFFASFENVVVEKDIGDEMFFIFRGAVEIICGDKQVKVLGENQYFGEMAILNSDSRRTATVRTLCFCELRMLSREKFLEALAHFPNMREKIASYAKTRVVTVGKKIRRSSAQKEKEKAASYDNVKLLANSEQKENDSKFMKMHCSDSTISRQSSHISLSGISRNDNLNLSSALRLHRGDILSSKDQLKSKEFATNLADEERRKKEYKNSARLNQIINTLANLSESQKTILQRIRTLSGTVDNYMNINKNLSSMENYVDTKQI